jgi:hypothetical protein
VAGEELDGRRSSANGPISLGSLPVDPANNFVVDRIQTGGPGNLNIPQDKVYELGNYQSVGIVRDVPDLTFSLDCLDVDTEIEALLTGSVDPGAGATSTKYTLGTSKPIDILSPWKSPYGDFAIVRGVAIPNLALESASYRYGLRDNAGEQFSLRVGCGPPAFTRSRATDASSLTVEQSRLTPRAFDFSSWRYQRVSSSIICAASEPALIRATWSRLHIERTRHAVQSSGSLRSYAKPPRAAAPRDTSTTSSTKEAGVAAAPAATHRDDVQAHVPGTGIRDGQLCHVTAPRYDGYQD